MTQPPTKKPAYNKGGYGSGNRERNPPPKKVVPPQPPQNDLQIYVNPNDPNDFIFLDYSPAYPAPPAPPTPSQSVVPFRPQYDYRVDESEDEDLLKLRRLVKNDKVLSNNRPAT